MRNIVQAVRRRTRRWFLLPLTILFIFALSLPASAELGAGIASVYLDTAHVNGTVLVTDAEHYTIYEIRTSTETTIREFVSSSGIVFGIAWEGRFIPEMNQFLGTHFDQYSAAVKAQTKQYRGRKPLEIHLSNFVFESNGHMGWKYGRAYVPESVPKQVRVEDIH
jgi:uncharacterized protein DUF2844